MAKTKDLSPKMNMLTAEQELLIPVGTELMGQNIGGLSFFSDVFKRGYGDDVFGTDSNGSWWGGADYSNAVSKIDYAGNATFTSITIDGYLADGEAAGDINANATKVNGAKIVDVSITSTQISDSAISTPKLQTNAVTADKIVANAITAGKISSNAVEADKIASNAITAGKIATNAVTAGTIAAGAVTADKISVSSLDAISATLGDVTVGGSSDALGTIIVKNSSSTEIAKLNSSGIIIRNTRGLFFEQTTGGNYFDISVNASNQAVFSLPTTNQFLIQNYAGDTNLFTVSSSATFSNQAFSVNAAVTCKELLLNYGQNEGAIRNVSNIEGYDDLNIYGNGTIRLYPGSSKVWFDKNIDLNEKDLDAGQTLWAYSFSNRSDKRLKKNIKDVGNALSDVIKLNPVSFNWKKNDEKSFGLIAQEVYQLFPDLVKKADDGYLSVDYISLIPFLVKAIQELYEMQTGKKLKKPLKMSEDGIKLFERTKKEIDIEYERKNPSKRGSEKK